MPSIFIIQTLITIRCHICDGWGAGACCDTHISARINSRRLSTFISASALVWGTSTGPICL